MSSMPSPTQSTDTAAKLDVIVTYLEQMNKRDRLRTIGGFIRGFLGLFPLVVLIWSLWYIANNGEALMKMVANQAASSAAQYTQQQGSGLVDQMLKQYSFPKQ